MNAIPDFDSALDMLAWQVELGADEAIEEEPVNRYDLPEAAPKANLKAPTPSQQPVIHKEEDIDAVVEARKAAASAGSLEALASAMQAFPHCELQRGAQNFVFADGLAAARVMVVGEAPGRDEDIQGKPFVGRAGQLLDRMFDAIGLSRQAEDAKDALYITNILPWRPPQNRDPSPEEMAMMLPFVKRHIELAAPEVLVLMGNISCHGLLGRRGITRLRGHWQDVAGRSAMPMFHPAYLLRNPVMKREAWADLLEIKARLKS